MSDIFISYSNNDREKASKLSHRLRDAGFSVWIDETGISAATQWSSEIVRAIEECKVFILLISSHSFASHNVIKELTLASEEKKHIIPVDIEPVELIHEVKYQLAGIQRVPYKDYPNIEAAVRRFIGANAEASIPSSPIFAASASKKNLLKKIVIPLAIIAILGLGTYFLFFAKTGTQITRTRADEIQKIVVLPFESLSSNKEDEYFADGLTAQVISTLSSLSGMQITDRQTSMRYKGKKSDLALIAKELGVRYVVDGTVQKQDNGVKITSQLVDTQTGKVLLSNEFQGTTDDVFALEEKLARSIAFELQGSLARTAVLDSNLIRQSTKNPEAYNKFLLGVGCLENVQTQVQLLKGIGYLEEALKLDPKFAYAQCVRALAYIGKYQASLDLRDLMIGDSLAKLTLQMDPSVVEAHLARMQIARMQGQTDSALQQANMLLEKQPDNISAHAFMGSIYYEKRDFYRAASHLERAVQKNITDLVSWSLLIDSYQAIGDTVKRNRFIDESIPLYELFLEKNPAIVSVRVHYALNLANRRLREKAHEQIAQVTKSTSIGPADYYNLACVYSQLGEAKPAIEMIKKTISLGNHPGPSLATDPDLINLHSNPEFKEIMKKEQVQKLTAE